MRHMSVTREEVSFPSEVSSVSAETALATVPNQDIPTVEDPMINTSDGGDCDFDFSLEFLNFDSWSWDSGF
jgi:hypothetical protein